jgi:stearoyl-CoA desaturase (delta-9 desaturase)
MKYLSSTPSTLHIIQWLSIALIIVCTFVADVSWQYVLLSIFMFYVYSVLGISMMLHRYYSHKSFKLNSGFKWFFTVFAVLAGRGSPLGWVYIHRIHHATSDTEKDPHSPHNENFKFIGFRPVQENKKINHFIVKELLTTAHIKIDQYYLLLILGFLVLLSIIDFNLVFYMWAIPVFLVSVTQTMFNYFAHTYGYRNYQTRDASTNNPYLWPFILGDAWHNNHHENAERISNKIKWFELDPVAVIIKLIRKNSI